MASVEKDVGVERDPSLEFWVFLLFLFYLLPDNIDCFGNVVSLFLREVVPLFLEVISVLLLTHK